MILLVTFLIKEKSDKRGQTATAALRLGKKELESNGPKSGFEAVASLKLQTSDQGRSKSQT
ncbi:hypothetical protein EFB08_08905 [Rufibacter latericius]|uniref:Uncharacterized protein n=1 Tax=Rufibacter latericius TaxID=2487040 RepID=A0A3M9MTA4_9BACT|nr:hypothetical protein EFB08_08905 [Rufibacter latericius]